MTIVVDPFSAPYLTGATIDFLDGLQESGFKIDNPNASSSCGCGHSFQVDDEAAADAQAGGGCGSGCALASRDARPLRVAVVGSGPAGFYAANALLSADPPAEVDMIERLPTPWGLVRLGVAPDHPKIKAVSRAFEKIGAAAGLSLLRQRRGRERRHARRSRRASTTRSSTRSARRPTGGSAIPGEDLPGSWSATEFVAWYNGHPDFQDLEFDLSGERAVVVGTGNVALDVARMLALTARGARSRPTRPTARSTRSPARRSRRS